VELAVVGSVGESVVTAEWIALMGLELGSDEPLLSDWGGSAYKRFKSRVCCVAK